MVRKEPQPLTEFRPNNFEADYQKKYDEQDFDSDTSDDDEKQPAKKAKVSDDDDWNDVGEDR